MLTSDDTNQGECFWEGQALSQGLTRKAGRARCWWEFLGRQLQAASQRVWPTALGAADGDGPETGSWKLLMAFGTEGRLSALKQAVLEWRVRPDQSFQR